MPEDKRHGARISTRFETLYCSERQEGAGVLRDISESGARLGESEIQPRIGAQVRLHVLLPDHEAPFELVGEVVRHTERGFAIAYRKPSPEACERIAKAARLLRPDDLVW